MDSFHRPETVCPPEVSGHPKRHRYAREDVRDHAIIRILLTGARRTEVACLQVEDLDLRSAVKIAVTGRIKGSRGRPLPLAPTVVAVNRWLRARAAAHSRPDPNRRPLWIAVKGGAALQSGAIYQDLILAR